MDATVTQYMRACRRFCDWVDQEGITIFPSLALDRALTLYMDMLCYDDEIGAGEGKNLASGMMAMYPALRLPESFRALKAWVALRPGQQGTPVAVPLLMEIIDRMASYGDKGQIAADAALLAFDCYLREQDWELMKAGDVVEAGGVTAIRLGAQERGERVKTGQEQGVLLDYPATRAMLQKRTQNLKAGDRVFPISQVAFRNYWYKATAELGVCELAGRPHNIRHTGPSFDVWAGYRDLREVQKRGRWRADASVTRYSKTHEYARSVSQVPPEILKAGEQKMRDLGERPDRPRS